MNRLLIMTVGKTHSGKTTFAKDLEQQLPNSLVIDQDNQAEFINTFYRKLLAKEGPNTIKYAVSRAIVDYAVNETNLHLILCNSNRNRRGRLNLLEEFQAKGFTTILISFELPDHVLQARVANSERSTVIFRTASTFKEVLKRQQAESDIAPAEEETDHFFVIHDSDETQSVISEIVKIAQS